MDFYFLLFYLPVILSLIQSNKAELTCSYPSLESQGWRNCNGPKTRDCWLVDRNGYQRFDINTDYELSVALTRDDVSNNYSTYPTGVTREYWLNVTDHPLAPDGYYRPETKLINGTLPGPVIEACWGDEIVVHVTNYMTDNGTTIHFHGIRQYHTNDMDGVNGVTQCPIAHGDTFTYKFRAMQYGNSWLHSHYVSQYSEGVVAPLIIYGPTSANWDERLPPITLMGWSHSSSWENFLKELHPQPSTLDPLGFPKADSTLINGIGNYTCRDGDDYSRCVGGGGIFTQTLKKGKRYLLSLLNASSDQVFIFSIDNHLLTMISTDLVPILPYTNTTVILGLAQRYNVIVEANPEPEVADGNYWMRANPAEGCISLPSYPNITDTQGIMRYQPNSTGFPTTSANNNVTTDCQEEPYANLKPVVPWYVGRPANNVTDDTFEAGILNETIRGALLWDLTATPMFLNFSNPTILNLENKTWDPAYAVVDYNYYNDQWVYMVVTDSLARINSSEDKTDILAAHPMHLHGHDVAILAQSHDYYDEETAYLSFNFNNPPRRDTIQLNEKGYTAIAFKADNPGTWLLHCHIVWHAAAGLALQVLEGQAEIAGVVGNRIEETKRICQNWDAWERSGFVVDQMESGV